MFLKIAFSVAKNYSIKKRDRHQFAIPLSQGNSGDVASSIHLPLSDAGDLHSVTNSDTDGLLTEDC